ncbi:MAG: NAD(P)-dependent oxidoreductase [Acidimicrobiia bacterium]|nr:NAD(P)-dependent oxidoreductase [Acidimicrobiia bacterium]MDH3397244.1 NAD(P)-dependent oxidoreductase [Acidimicrobiia bacterium]
MTEASGSTNLGWIGTGVMGASMAGHLLTAGYPVTVFTRSRAKAAELERRGATWADSPAAVAAASDVTFAIVGFPADVRDVFLGEHGALAGAKAGSLLVDMTTSEPSLALEIAAAAAPRGVGAVDAPVSGGDVGARNATLSIMIGGADEDVRRVWPLFEILGKTLVHLGGPGAGQHTKMVNQILIATGMIGVSEALLYAQQAGLDLDKALEAVSGGAAGSWSLSNYGPRMLAGDFDPGFTVDHFVKDMGIALDEAKAMQLSVPGLALAHQLYVALQAQDGGRNGTQALLLALARLSDTEWSRGG